MKSPCHRIAVIGLTLGVFLLPSIGFADASPGISTQPQSLNVLAGSNAVFTVVASGQALIYQWSVNGTNLTNSTHISGVTNTTLNISNVVVGDAGNYQVLVSNSHGSVLSSNALLTVIVTNHYVNVNSSNPKPPYADWSTAATNIQDAVDVSASGDFVWVTNGVYRFGNRVTSATTNCVVDTNVITISSVSGATQTVIDGSGSKRCVYLTAGTLLTGFTLTNGVTSENGGGAYQGTLLNCTLTHNSAVFGGGAYGSTLSNCILVANSATNGGGSADSVLYNCTLFSNSTKAFGYAGGAYTSTLNNCFLVGNNSWSSGGGAGACTLFSCVLSNNNTSFGAGAGADNSALSNCIVTGNIAWNNGGGAENCTLVQSLIVSNAAPWGGGVDNCILTNCVLRGNTANDIYTGGGGAANNSTLYNCLLVKNLSMYFGGGALGSTLVNCTVADNSSYQEGGGVHSCEATNSIVYYNASYVGDNYFNGSMSWCCTTPLYDSIPPGVSNISSEPLFVDHANGNYHLYPGSPCIDAGSNVFVPVALDLDGNQRIVGGTVDIGAYEFQNSPFIEVQPVGQTVPVGQSSVSFSVVAFGSGLTYQWRLNGTNISSATNSTFVLSAAQLSDAGIYSVLITNNFGVALSSNAVLSVLFPPTVTLQPTNQAVPLNSNVTFIAAVSGDAPLNYQWFFNGSALTDGGQFSGTTITNLAITNLQLTNMGNYLLVVTNLVGFATSSAAVLTVISPPTVTTPFTNQVAMVFNSATLSISDFGTPPLFYQWQKSGVNLTDNGNISGSTESNLTISIPQLADTGEYSVIVTNVYGAITNTATLTVVPVLNWGDTLLPPVAVTNAIGITIAGVGPYHADFTVQADGSLVGWGDGFDGLLDNLPSRGTNFVSIFGGDGQIIAIHQDGSVASWGVNGSFVPANATNVIAAIANNAGSIVLRQDGTIVTWNGAQVPPASATNIIAIGAGRWGLGSYLAVRQDGTVIGWGDNAWGETSVPAEATNVVAVSCGYRHSLVLRADGSVVGFGVGEGTPPSNLTNVTAIAAGWDNSLVLHQDGTVVGWGNLGNAPASISNVVAIADQDIQSMVLVRNPDVMVSPKIIQQPLSAVTQTNRSVILEGQAVGSSPMQYQWYFNGAQLGGQTNRWLLLSPVQSSQGGNYQFVVQNSFGSVTSQTAIVWTPPSITIAATTVAFGSNAVVNATVSGTPPFGFQWYFNGTPLNDGGSISGSTTTNLTILNFQPANVGNYTIVATNATGSAAGTAVINVQNPLIAGQPHDQSVFAGATVNIGVTATGQQPLAYQWLFNGANISDATNNPLVLTNVLVSQAGTYSVVVTNDYGIVVSSNATLTVNALAIITQPTNQVTWPGGVAKFKVNVSGMPPFNFEWQCNGTDVPGTWTNVLTLTNLQLSQFGTYNVIVNNAYGSAVSSNAILSLSRVAVWGGSAGETNLIPGLTNIIAIAAGAPSYPDCLALKGNNVAIHWPRTNYVGISNVVAIVGNGWQEAATLALKTNNTVVAWFLADDVTESLAGYTNVAAIAPYFYTQFALRTNGTLLGGSAGTIAKDAGTITNILNAVAIAEGAGHSMALTADGKVIAWGNNTYGQTNVPAGLSNIIAIAAGYYHNLALKSDGTVVAWGEDNYGQINIPKGLSNVVAIAAGQYHSMALRANGTVVAWGYNAYGQTNVPPGLTNVIAIAAGEYHSMALIGDAPPNQNALLTNPAIGTNGFSLSLPSQSGRVYVLQYKTLLSDSNWTSLPLMPGNGGTLLLQDPFPTNQQRFYRVQTW